MSALPQNQPVSPSSTPSLRGPEASGGHPHRPYISEANVVSSPGSGIGTAAPEKRAPNESPIKISIAGTQLDIAARFRRRDVRTDGAAHPPLGSRRSARLLVLGPGVTRACPFASSGACDSDGNTPRSFSEVASQAGFTEYDHMIQALPPKGADHPLDIGSLPGRPGCREHLLEQRQQQCQRIYD